MNELLSQAESIWGGIQSRIGDLRQDGYPLESVVFVPRARLRAGQQTDPVLHVISRLTRVIEWGANRGVAELGITFGITQTTFRPEKVGDDLESLIRALVDSFMRAPTLGGADDFRVDEINPDGSPFGPEDTQPWATATLAWVFQFTQP